MPPAAASSREIKESQQKEKRFALKSCKNLGHKVQNLGAEKVGGMQIPVAEPPFWYFLSSCPRRLLWFPGWM